MIDVVVLVTGTIIVCAFLPLKKKFWDDPDIYEEDEQ